MAKAIKTEFNNVDANDAAQGWKYDLVRRPEFRYRVFFKSDTSLVNSLNATDLHDWLATTVGAEDIDWVLVDSRNPMEDIWNRGKQDKEAEKYGNHIYLHSIQKLVKGVLPDQFFETITVVETRVA